MDKKIIALVQGDPAGIGLELMVKLLLNKKIINKANILINNSSSWNCI